VLDGVANPVRHKGSRNPIFSKNRIYQDFQRFKKSDFFKKSDLSGLSKVQEIRFFQKIGFIRTFKGSRNPIFSKNRISQDSQRFKKSDFF
jgi:hypothetical protein